MYLPINQLNKSRALHEAIFKNKKILAIPFKIYYFVT